MPALRFSSFFSSLMVTAGLAIGIGNVWRFPYMMGSYGGSAFLVVFILFIVLLTLPALMSEWALARHTRQGTIGAFTATFGLLYGRLVGYALLCCLTIAGGYYLVVIGHVFYSTYFATVHGFGQQTTRIFQSGLHNPFLQLSLALFILFIAAFIIHRGVKSGIELVSKLFVPFFFLSSFYLVCKVLTLPGAVTHLSMFLQVDFSKIGFTEVFAAMGQAYFSIGLGATLTLIYGSYLKDEIKLPRLGLMTCLGDTGAALLASLYLIPALLVFGVELTSGPTLLFETLPDLFSTLPGGRLFGSLMLGSLFLVALLSYVALLEALVGGLLGDVERLHINKRQLLIGLVTVQALLLLPFTFYPQLIASADMLFGSAAMLIGGCLALLALAWGIGRANTIKQVFGNGYPRLARAYFFWIKWFAPMILFITLSGTLYESLAGS